MQQLFHETISRFKTDNLLRTKTSLLHCLNRKVGNMVNTRRKKTKRKAGGNRGNPKRSYNVLLFSGGGWRLRARRLVLRFVRSFPSRTSSQKLFPPLVFSLILEYVPVCTCVNQNSHYGWRFARTLSLSHTHSHTCASWDHHDLK